MAESAIPRRKFVQQTAAAAAAGMAAPWIVPAHALGRGGRVAASERITIGMIGTGDHGIGRNLAHLLDQPDAQVVAVCDVDTERRERARRTVEEHEAAARASGSSQGCTTHGDFREILARDDVDAVMISTPDHWHVLPAVLAARAGKDVICEKPLSLTVAEGRILSDVVARHGTVFQTSSENRSVPEYHRMAELVRNGRIGALRAIRVGLPGGHWVREASFETGPPPASLDYDLWLGPAPEAPYCPARCHWNFRWITDYSGGMLTDWGAHLIDLAQWANDSERTGPVEIEGKGEFPEEGLYDTATAFEVTCRYASGVELVITSTEPSLRFEGSDGWIGNEGWRGTLQASSPAILEAEIGPEETHLETCPGGEHRNFLDCVKTRAPCYAPAEVGHRTISIAHLGNIAMRLGRKLRWDPDREHCIDDPAADAMLSRPMRAPWTLDP